MAFALPADTNGSTGLPTQQRCRAQSRRRPWPGWRGAAARYHPLRPLRASQLSDCSFRAVTSSSGPDSQDRTCPRCPITEGCNTPGCCSPVAKPPLVGRGRRRRLPSLRNAHHVAPPPHHLRRRTTVNSGQPHQGAKRALTLSLQARAPAAGTSSQDSQAQSASSILVTRSMKKPQAIGPGLLCCLDQFRRRAPDPHQKASPWPRTGSAHEVIWPPSAVAQGRSATWT